MSEATCAGLTVAFSKRNNKNGSSAADSLGEECQACNEPCVDEFETCSGLTPETVPVAKCDESDVEQYLLNGANSTRPVHSNYCSREYEIDDFTGCLLNTECISECFQETYGYSASCSECFVQIPVCSVMTGCTLFWWVRLGFGTVTSLNENVFYVGFGIEQLVWCSKICHSGKSSTLLSPGRNTRERSTTLIAMIIRFNQGSELYICFLDKLANCTSVFFTS